MKDWIITGVDLPGPRVREANNGREESEGRENETDRAGGRLGER